MALEGLGNQTKLWGGGLVQLVSYGASGLYLFGNPEVSFFAGGTSKKLLHPELHRPFGTPFHPRTDDVKDFPKENYCGAIVFKEDEPILKRYGDSRYFNEEDHLVPFKVRGDTLKPASVYTPGDAINTVVPYES